MVREGVFLGEKKKTHKSFEMELYKKWKEKWTHPHCQSWAEWVPGPWQEERQREKEGGREGEGEGTPRLTQPSLGSWAQSRQCNRAPVLAWPGCPLLVSERRSQHPIVASWPSSLVTIPD
jgi:hypothetical protein